VARAAEKTVVHRLFVSYRIDDIEVISTRQVPVLEVGEYQGGFRDRVGGPHPLVLA
jgi:hypothetical protein